MSALNPFLRAAESRALADHEARILATPLDALLKGREPAQPRRLHRDRDPAKAPSERIAKGKAPSLSTRLEILRMGRMGVPHAEIARRFECSERTVQRYLKKGPPARGLGELP